MPRSGVVSKRPSRSRSIANVELQNAEEQAVKEKFHYVERDLKPGFVLGVGVKFAYSLKSDGVHGGLNLTNLTDEEAVFLINAREMGPEHLQATIERLLVDVPAREHEAQG